MIYRGISLKPERHAGGSLTLSLSLLEGHESAAGAELLSLLENETEISLCNDLDEGHEGMTYFRRSGAQLLMKVCGHGWRGDWKPVDKAEFCTLIEKLGPLNRGGHWRAQGQLIRENCTPDQLLQLATPDETWFKRIFHVLRRFRR
jgi:hypothetical protein